MKRTKQGFTRLPVNLEDGQKQALGIPEQFE
jgi:hypothetical protein